MPVSDPYADTDAVYADQKKTKDLKDIESFRSYII